MIKSPQNLIIIVLAVILSGCVGFNASKEIDRTPRHFTFNKVNTFSSCPSQQNRVIACQTKAFTRFLTQKIIESESPPDRKEALIKRFKKDPNNSSDIILFDLCQAGQRNITRNLHPKDLAYFVHPIWSPDGQKVAFIGYTNIRPLRNRKGVNVNIVDYDVGVYVLTQENFEVSKIYEQRNNGEYLPTARDGVAPGWSKEATPPLTQIKWTSDSQQILFNDKVIPLDKKGPPQIKASSPNRVDFSQSAEMEKGSLSAQLQSPDGIFHIAFSIDKREIPTIPHLEIEGYFDLYWTTRTRKVIPVVRLISSSGEKKCVRGPLIKFNGRRIANFS